MRRSHLTLALTALALAAAGGCSKTPSADGATAGAPAEMPSSPDAAAIQKAVDAANAPRPLACTLVTAADMSAILGATVTAQPHEGTVDKTECIYKPANAPSPYAELTIDWEDGKQAMTAMGGMNKVEPGISNPYAGIGDQAVAVGTALMVLDGDDMVTITFSGVDDMPGKARKVFDTAKPRMHPGH